MAQIYVITPFGDIGDKGAIPQTTPPDGSVSFEDGFGVNYQLDPDTDPDGLDIPRLQFNQLMYEMTLNIQQYQQHGFPEFIAAADNGGVAFEYGKDDHVRYANGWAGAAVYIYYSLDDGNTTNPSDSTKWGLVQYSTPIAPGTTEIWPFNTIKPGGYVWVNGTTIGNASSNATQRANADTSALFALIWGSYSQTVCPLLNSSGAVTARGVSAAADYAANCQITLPDWCGRALFGLDNMGGITAKGRITTPGSGISGTTPGAAGGVETVQLTSNQNGQHSHTGTTDSSGTHFHGGSTDSSGSHTHTVGKYTAAQNPGGSTIQANTNQGANNTTTTSTSGAHTHTLSTDTAGAHTHGFTTSSSGLGSAHQNMPPAVICGGFIMKL